MKSILLSKQPKIVANVLNGISKIIVCKKFPKDYVGWVYLCCTKGKPYLYKFDIDDRYSLYPRKSEKLAQQYKDFECFNGKVVARFWCDKVEEITCRPICGEWESYTETLGYSEISQASCLKNKEIVRYLRGKNGYAIHIYKLEVFDKPRELCEFKTPKQFENYQRALCEASEDDYKLWEKYDGDFPEDVCANNVELIEMAEGYYGLTKAPKNYCYIESKE